MRACPRACADGEELHRVETVFGRQSFGRKTGDALHPEREPSAMLRADPPYIRRIQFCRQMPSPQGGGMVKAAWFRSYAANERPEKFDRIVQSWDTANKATEASDFSVCTTGDQEQGPLSAARAAQAHGISRIVALAAREQCEAFAASLTVFPNGKHDDQVDATAQMLDWFKQAGRGPSSNAGIWHLYKQRYEAQRAGASQTERPEPCR
jgi:hypothetical protein